MAEEGKLKELSDILVVSDVDGTLLQAGFGIPKANIDAVEHYVGKGGLFTVATGRGVQSVRRYIDWITLSAPAILYNGALIYDYDKESVLYVKTLDSAVLEIVKDILKAFPDIGVELHGVENLTLVNANEETERHTAEHHLPYVLADVETVQGAWCKVLFAASEQRALQLQNFIDDRKKTHQSYNAFQFIRTSNKFMEIIPKNVNKGTGLKQLAEMLGIEMIDTVAIGDYYNDMDMLSVAGFKVAVANAPMDVRSKADRTVASCLEGGVAELLESLETIGDGYVQLKLE